MRVLITGGSGYIGAHVCRLLVDAGHVPVIVDDLVNGLRERVSDLGLHEFDLAAAGAHARLASILRTERVDAVIHFAARKQVGESVARPLWYYRQNLGSLANVLSAMVEAGVERLVFSSSAAVYGDARGSVDESALAAPVNPYGETKIAGEWLVSGAARAHGLKAVSLRYFNVAGAGWPELADRAVLNLVPMVLERLDDGLAPQIFGDDYPTADGTCVRDFVHVLDVAAAHIAALESLAATADPHRVYNVGTGRGASVREVVEGIRARYPGARPPVIDAPRAGDPASVVADVTRIEQDLSWRATRTLDEILDSAVAAWTDPPDRYRSRPRHDRSRAATSAAITKSMKPPSTSR